MQTSTDAINARLRAKLQQSASLSIPPPCLIDMAGDVFEYVENENLQVRFPVLARYRNPMGHMQGGFIVAALDNTLGPFSYLIAPPSVTASLNTQYVRPVTETARFITCKASILERTRNSLHLAGEARSDDGKVVALCQAICQIMPAP